MRSDELVIAKTADRSVLGCMTSLDDRALNRRLRRNINSARDYQRPIDLVRERLAP
jgi:hypothetical protein